MTSAHVIGFLVGLGCGLLIGLMLLLRVLVGVRRAIRGHCETIKTIAKKGVREIDEHLSNPTP